MTFWIILLTFCNWCFCFIKYLWNKAKIKVSTRNKCLHYLKLSHFFSSIFTLCMYIKSTYKNFYLLKLQTIIFITIVRTKIHYLFWRVAISYCVLVFTLTIINLQCKSQDWLYGPIVLLCNFLLTNYNGGIRMFLVFY